MVVSSLLHFSADRLLWVRERALPAGPPGHHSLRGKQETNASVMGPGTTRPWHRRIQSLLPSLQVQGQRQTLTGDQSTQAEPDHASHLQCDIGADTHYLDRTPVGSVINL